MSANIPNRDWIDYLQALLTPVIAVLGIYIGWVQWRLARNKYNFERFDKKIEYFFVVYEFLRKVVRETKVTRDDLIKYMRDTAGIRLIFGDKLGDYIDEIYHKAVALDETNLQMNPATNSNKRIDLIQWLAHEMENLEKRFISKIR